MSVPEHPACQRAVGIEPPFCCQPPIRPAFISTRAYLASLAPGEHPTHCPNCGSSEIAPLFWPDNSSSQFDCGDCFAIFSSRD